MVEGRISHNVGADHAPIKELIGQKIIVAALDSLHNLVIVLGNGTKVTVSNHPEAGVIVEVIDGA